jgi:hypothetical protein
VSGGLYPFGTGGLQRDQMPGQSCRGCSPFGAQRPRLLSPGEKIELYVC